MYAEPIYYIFLHACSLSRYTIGSIAERFAPFWVHSLNIWFCVLPFPMQPWHAGFLFELLFDAVLPAYLLCYINTLGQRRSKCIWNRFYWIFWRYYFLQVQTNKVHFSIILCFMYYGIFSWWTHNFAIGTYTKIIIILLLLLCLLDTLSPLIAGHSCTLLEITLLVSQSMTLSLLGWL